MQNPHPYFVHFPIALFVASFLFDLLGVLLDQDTLKHAGWWCLVAGVIGAAGASTTGWLAEESMQHGHGGAVGEVLEQHKTSQLIVTGLFAVLLVWRAWFKTKLPEKAGLLWTYLLLALAGIGIMGYGAHLGGRLVYEFGEGTSIEQEQTEDHSQHHHAPESETPSDEHDHQEE